MIRFLVGEWCTISVAFKMYLANTAKYFLGRNRMFFLSWKSWCTKCLPIFSQYIAAHSQWIENGRLVRVSQFRQILFHFPNLKIFFTETLHKIYIPYFAIFKKYSGSARCWIKDFEFSEWFRISMQTETSSMKIGDQISERETRPTRV